MKQTNGWSKPPHRNSSHRGGRRNNSGSYSLKYQRNNSHRNARGAFFDTIKERLNFTFKNLAGKEVTLKLSNGVIIKGILIASSHESVSGNKVTIQYCKVVSRPEGNQDVIPSGESKYVVQWGDMAYILGPDEKPIASATNKLKTDSDITRSNIMAGKISGRQLQVPDSTWLKKPANMGKAELSSLPKLGAWDQFKVNEEKFGVKGTFKEDLYTTSLDKSTLTPEQIAKAKQAAKEIEGKSTSNQHIREERNQPSKTNEDEESKYSAVPRTSHPEKAKLGPPLNFAAALMKGKTQPIKSKDRFQTPVRTGPKTKLAETENTKRDSKAKASEKKVNKFEVSDIDFSTHKRERLVKGMRTPVSKNWDAHSFTKRKLDAGRDKTRAQQINEFREFSTSYDNRKEKSKKTLNVNAKEFRPPVAQYQQVVAPAAPEQVPPKNGTEEETKGTGPTPTRQPTNPAAGQNFVQQPGVWQVPMPPHMPMNFYHPLMIPPGAQVYPQNASGNIIMPGHPYVVHMIPPAGMHPYAQGQRIPANFAQQPQVIQVTPGMQQGTDLTDAQKQMMQIQAQQFQQTQQQQQQRQQAPNDPKA